MKINFNCRYFLGDRPCKFHKQEGVSCEECPYYDEIKFRILIIKLDSIGDVLRTTCILKGLKEKYPASQITWITKEEALELFYNNEMVDLVVPYQAAVLELLTNKYDLVLSLDASHISAKLSSLAKSKKKIGVWVFFTRLRLSIQQRSKGMV